MRDLKAAEADVHQYTEWMNNRFYWANVLAEMRQALLTVEQKSEEDLKAKTGVWIERLIATNMMSGAAGQTADSSAAGPRGKGKAARAPKAPGSEINTLLLTCRGVNLSSRLSKPAANTQIAYAIRDELKARTNLFDPNGVQLGGIGEEQLTFTSDFTVKLKRGSADPAAKPAATPPGTGASTAAAISGGQ
jgi:hypothetical protein